MGSASSVSSTWATMDGGGEAPPRVPLLDADLLGPPDAQLVGQGWSIPVHQCAPAPPTLPLPLIHELPAHPPRGTSLGSRLPLRAGDAVRDS